MVFFTHRHAAAGENQIMCLCSIAQSGFRRIQVVRHDAQIRHLTTQALQHRTQKESVRVVNTAGWHVLGRDITRHHQLIAGGKQRHFGATNHRQCGQTNAGCQTN